MVSNDFKFYSGGQKSLEKLKSSELSINKSWFILFFKKWISEPSQKLYINQDIV
jgi:hypothetical protein